MKILFAFNGSQAESELTSIIQPILCKQPRTRGTDLEIVSVPQSDTVKACNDGAYDLSGQDGQTGRVEFDVKPVNIPIKLAKVAEPVIIPIVERRVATDPINYSDSDDFDVVEYRKKIALNTKLVSCESCIHFDFLATPTSQSCMISAAKPHKRYPRMTLQDVVAECDKRELHQILDHNIQSEIWNHETDYPF